MTRRSPARTRRPPENRRAQGQAPPSSRKRGNPARGRSHEDTFLGRRPAPPAPIPQGNRPIEQSPRPRPVRLGHIHKSASPFNQHQPRNPCRTTRTTCGGTVPPGNRNQTWSSPNVGPQIGSSDHTEQNLACASPAVDRGARGGGPVAVGQWRWASGGERDRTDDLLLAKQALSQLSYTPGQRSESRGQRSDLFSDL
jgi:hypothetical protein